jgi:hypothetical protein
MAVARSSQARNIDPQEISTQMFLDFLKCSHSDALICLIDANKFDLSAAFTGKKVQTKGLSAEPLFNFNLMSLTQIKTLHEILKKKKIVPTLSVIGTIFRSLVEAGSDLEHRKKLGEVIILFKDIYEDKNIYRKLLEEPRIIGAFEYNLYSLLGETLTYEQFSELTNEFNLNVDASLRISIDPNPLTRSPMTTMIYLVECLLLRNKNAKAHDSNWMKNLGENIAFLISKGASMDDLVMLFTRRELAINSATTNGREPQAYVKAMKHYIEMARVVITSINEGLKIKTAYLDKTSAAKLSAGSSLFGAKNNSEKQKLEKLLNFSDLETFKTSKRIY